MTNAVTEFDAKLDAEDAQLRAELADLEQADTSGMTVHQMYGQFFRLNAVRKRLKAVERRREWRSYLAKPSIDPYPRPTSSVPSDGKSHGEKYKADGQPTLADVTGERLADVLHHAQQVGDLTTGEPGRDADVFATLEAADAVLRACLERYAHVPAEVAAG